MVKVKSISIIEKDIAYVPAGKVNNRLGHPTASSRLEANASSTAAPAKWKPRQKVP